MTEIIVAILTAVVSSLITGKIIATYYLKIMDEHIKENTEMIMDLISWAKEIDKY